MVCISIVIKHKLTNCTQPTLHQQTHLSCYPATVHSRFKYDRGWATQWGRQSSTLRGPRGFEVEDKMVQKNCLVQFANLALITRPHQVLKDKQFLVSAATIFRGVPTLPFVIVERGVNLQLNNEQEWRHIRSIRSHEISFCIWTSKPGLEQQLVKHLSRLWYRTDCSQITLHLIESS